MRIASAKKSENSSIIRGMDSWGGGGGEGKAMSWRELRGEWRRARADFEMHNRYL